MNLSRTTIRLVFTAALLIATGAARGAPSADSRPSPSIPVKTFEVQITGVSVKVAKPGAPIFLNVEGPKGAAAEIVDALRHQPVRVYFSGVPGFVLVADATSIEVITPKIPPGPTVITLDGTMFTTSGWRGFSIAADGPAVVPAGPIVPPPDAVIAARFLTPEKLSARPGEFLKLPMHFSKRLASGAVPGTAVRVYFDQTLAPTAGLSANTATTTTVLAEVPTLPPGPVKAIRIDGAIRSIAPLTGFSIAPAPGPPPPKPTVIPSTPVAPVEWNFLGLNYQSWALFLAGVTLLVGGFVYFMISARRTSAKLAALELQLRRSRLSNEHATRPGSSPATPSFDDDASTVGDASTGPAGDTDEADRDEDIVDLDNLDFPVPDELVSACAAGNCVVVAGSGLPALTGLPTWTNFISELLSQFEMEEHDGQWEGAQKMQLSVTRQTDAIVDLILARGREAKLAAAVIATYSRPGPLPEEIANFFAETPLLGAMTTNFDQLIETAAANRSPKVMTLESRIDFSSVLREKQFFVLKLNGDVANPTSIAVRPEHYAEFLEETPYLRTFVRSLFGSQTLFIVGMSIEGIEWLFQTTGIRSAASTRHFALVAETPDFEIARERMRARYGLELLKFKATPGFTQLPAVFQRLNVAIKERIENNRASATAATIMPAKVQSLRLQNIGPFRDAEIFFKSQWTVLLGNNGSGKSSILRAIALALSSYDSAALRAAPTLLKAGETTGTIDIVIDGKTFKTSLVNRQNSFSLKAEQGSPLQSRTMLVLGIPAVRGVSMPAPPSDGRKPEPVNFPRAEDVLPLLRGGPDGRMSGVRQWIVNTDQRSRDTHLSEPQRKRYERMLKTFFEIVDDMVPGFDVELLSSNSETGEIILDTSDGKLPLDYISQGMLSTIGWVGILLQRLYEIYIKSDDPTHEYALLLIDEIDSHLHPEWQQLLVPQIRKHFPGLQIIATTHSPLLVGSLEAGEVVRVRRDPDNPIEAIDHSFKDYRTDQILTSEPFGLHSTRSPEWQQINLEYRVLLANSHRSKEEEAKLAELAAKLRETTPAMETAVEREGARVVDNALRERVTELAGASNPEVIAAALDHLKRIIS